MIALRIEFLAGQFHANPWDRGTNEGEIDWPPSPWRVLRAIVAGWFRDGARDRETLQRILDALAEPPIYDLPFAASGHTRHYVPLGGLKGGKPERTLLIDSFLALERGREHGTHAFVIWESVNLDPTELGLLERCCALIRYLGRAESWCEVTLATDIPSGPGRYRVDLASRHDGDGPVVRRLAASPSLRGAGLLCGLTETTGEMRGARRMMPRGTVWVEYQLPPDFGLVTEQVIERERERPAFPPTIFRFAVDAENGVLPSVTKTVAVAETMRKAAISKNSKLTGGPASKRLAGKQSDGADRREGHDHPFFLPLDIRGRGFVDAVDVWFPGGCTHDEFRAVTSIRDIWDPVILEARYAMTYLGRVEPPTATRWFTATPIILDRHPKMRGPGRSVLVDGPEDQLRRALDRRNLGCASIEVWNPRETIHHRAGGRTRLDAFRRSRLGERPIYPAVGATIVFDEPVVGPIAVGRLAHFGLGRFEPDDNASISETEP
ncbi:MAG: type I-G CRISPR-associated protein Csb2 [Vulcanimicrobiaceae bacterium]